MKRLGLAPMVLKVAGTILISVSYSKPFLCSCVYTVPQKNVYPKLATSTCAYTFITTDFFKSFFKAYLLQGKAQPLCRK